MAAKATGSLAIGVLVAALAAGWAADPAPPNMVRDGGFEEVRECVVAADRYIRNAIYEQGVDMGEDAPVVLLPAAFSQFCGCKRLIVVEGAPSKEVHSGKRALLFSGSFYLQGGGPAGPRDVLQASYWARGKGKVRLILHLTDTNGRYFAQAVPDPIAVDSQQWVPVRHTLEMKAYQNLASIWPRMEATGDVVIDDLSLVRAGRSETEN